MSTHIKNTSNKLGGRNFAYRRWVMYIFCFVTVSVVTGIVYGWPALRKQLQEDGSTLHESTLGAVFTVGSWSTQGGRFFTGLARDRFGTKWVVASCTIFAALGSVGVAWSSPDNAAALGVSLFFIGLGSGAQLCVQPVAGLFPKTTGTVLASLSGAFQLSGLVFLALTSGDNVGTRKVRFSVFAILVVILCFVSMILLPKGKSFLLEEDFPETNSTEVREGIHVGNECHDRPSANTTATASASSSMLQEATPLEVGDKSSETKQNLNQSIEEGIEADGATSTRSEVVVDDIPATHAKKPNKYSAVPPTALEQMKSAEYILLCVWFSVCLIPLQYYVGSIGFQLEEMGDDDGFYTDLFSILYASAIVFSPAGGFLSDKLSLGVTQALATWLCAASFFLLASDVSLDAQAVGLLFYGVGRLLVFGMYFANCGKRFGYTNFGTLAGFGLLVSALFSLLQYPMISGAAHGHSRMINVGSGIALLLQTPYFVWLHRRERIKLS